MRVSFGVSKLFCRPFLNAKCKLKSVSFILVVQMLVKTAPVTGHIRIRAKSQVTVAFFEMVSELNTKRKNLCLSHFYI